MFLLYLFDITTPNFQHLSTPKFQHLSIPNFQHLSTPNVQHLSTSNFLHLSTPNFRLQHIQTLCLNAVFVVINAVFKPFEHKLSCVYPCVYGFVFVMCLCV